MDSQTPTSPQSSPEEDELSLHSLLVRLSVGLVVLLAAVAALSLTVREPLEAVSRQFVEQFGLAGLFFGVIFTDASPLPLTHEPLLFFAWSGGVDFWIVFAVAAAGSVSAGIVGWTCGRFVGRSPWLQRKFDRYRIRPFLQRYGAAAVGVAALTPFPFAIATWSAGAAGMEFKPLLLGALVRVPKVLFYLSLIVAGWNVGA